MHGLRRTYHRLRNHFGRTQWYFKVTRLKWKLDLVYVEIVLILTQDKCTKHTIGSEIILDTPMVLQGDETQVKGRFGLLGDSANLDAR